MSRTYKDKPRKFTDPEQDWDYRHYTIPFHGLRRVYDYDDEGWGWHEYEYSGTWFAKKPGVLTKKKKRVDTEWHWQSTPSWWTRMYMNRPQRHKSNQYMRQLTIQVDLEVVDPPLLSNKPHIYYW